MDRKDIFRYADVDNLQKYYFFKISNAVIAIISFGCIPRYVCRINQYLQEIDVISRQLFNLKYQQQ